MFDNKNVPHYLTSKTTGWKKYIGLSFLVVVFSFIIPFLSQATTYAADIPLPEQSDTKIQKLLLNRFIGYCLKNSALSGGILIDNGGRITGNAAANKGDWFMGSAGFQNTTGSIGPYMTDNRFGLWSGADDGGASRSAGLGDCGDEKTVAKAISALGGNGVEILCKSGFVRADGSDGGTVQGCIAGNGDFRHANNAKGGSNDTYNKFTQAYPEPGMDDRDWYWFYRKTFNWSCGYGKMDTAVNKATADANSEFGYSLTYVTNTPPYSETKYFIGAEKRGTTIETRLSGNGSESSVNKSCAEIEGHIKDLGAKYAAYLTSLEGTEDLEGQLNPPSADDGEGITEGSSSCTIAGVGWVVCPAITFLSGIADGAFMVIQNFLRVNVATYSTESGTFVAWATFRDIANVLFVIAFLFILFSQLTGQGISNYGVKKTLPRLIVTVILVNVSFYVCQIAVDVTQIVGGGVIELLKNIPVGTAQPSSWSIVMGDVIMNGGLLAGIVVTGAVAFSIAALSISSAVLLAFLIAVLMTVVILIGRQAAIVILIVMAPLAFVLYLLPNTEKWFKRWIKMFWALLLVYPIVAILYGGGDLAAKIIANVGNTSTDIDAQTKFWFGIIAIGVSAIPLIMTPVLLRQAMKSTGDIGGKLSGFASKANSRVKSSANATSRLGEARSGIKNRFALARAKRRGNSPIQQSIDNSKIGRALGLDKGSARALSIVDEEYEKQVRDAGIPMASADIKTLEDIAVTGMQGDQKVTAATRAAAIDKVMQKGGFNNRRAVLEAMASQKNSTTKELRNRAVQAAYAKGDANIYGTSFGDQIVQEYKKYTDADGNIVEKGAINSADDLVKQVVSNVASGSLSAEQLVQGEGSAKYLVNSVLKSGDATAKTKLTNAAVVAKSNTSTAPRVTSAIKESFAKLGVSDTPVQASGSTTSSGNAPINPLSTAATVGGAAGATIGGAAGAGAARSVNPTNVVGPVGAAGVASAASAAAAANAASPAGTDTSTPTQSTSQPVAQNVAQPPAQAAIVTPDGGMTITHGDQAPAPAQAPTQVRSQAQAQAPTQASTSQQAPAQAQPSTQGTPVDPFTTRNTQRQPEVDTKRDGAQTPQEFKEWQDQQGQRDRTTSGTRATEEPTKSDAQGRPLGDDRPEDTDDRTTR